jgi:hypothetical protein
MIIKKTYFLFCFLLFANTINATFEYFYPVDYCKKNNTTLIMHQNSLQKTTLLLWDHISNTTIEGLWSLFNPLNIQILPDESGFSFLDNGRLRIKYFNKRSAKTIDFDHYIYNVYGLNWINSQQCIFSAKYTDYYSIFSCSIDGSVQCLVTQDKSHCIYPQKIDDTLFYIQQNSQINSIKSCNFTNTQANNSHLINFNNSILFLNMISSSKGFVVEHNTSYEKEDKKNIAHFYFTQITHVNGTWESKRLFAFNIPLCLLLPHYDEFICESLLPLMPRIIDNKIYFINADHYDNSLKSYVFDSETQQIMENIFIGKNYFVPILSDKKLIFGGQLNHINDIIVHPF